MAILVTFGVATATYELTALMLLQRVSRLDIIAQVFALVEALQMAMLAVGAALVPLAVHLFGSHWAPAAIGVLFVAFTASIGTSVVLIDRKARVPITEMATLRATPLFGALPGPALETVAREARRIEAKAGHRDRRARRARHGVLRRDQRDPHGLDRRHRPGRAEAG